MLQLIDKKIKVYFYIILFLLFSTLFNLNISNNFEEKFKIIDIQKNIDEIEVIEINKLNYWRFIRRSGYEQDRDL